MSSLQSFLLRPGERKIEHDFDWQKIEGDPNTALYAPAYLSMLEAEGLGRLVTQPDNTEFRDALDARTIGYGSFGSVYELEDTGIVVKKHYSEMVCGKENDKEQHMRKVPSSSILDGLAVNLMLEEALKSVSEYSTPYYIGHLMLTGVRSDVVRHYTLMTKVREATPESSEERQRIQELKEFAVGSCRTALRQAGMKANSVRWDIEDSRGFRNAIPTRDESGTIVLAIIDQRSWHSGGKRLYGARLVSQAEHDPDAPWLSAYNQVWAA